jgi:hypothetical protein
MVSEALVKHDEPSPNTTALTVKQQASIDPEVLARAAAIWQRSIAEGGQLTPEAAIAAAYHFQTTGEVVGRHSYIVWKGRGKLASGTVIEGYRAVSRNLDMSRYQWRHRALTDEERKLHAVGPKDKSMACELDVLEARRKCIEMKIPYQPIVGITVVRESDNLQVPANRTAAWVMMKQSRVDALRQVGENTAADEVLDEAEENGVEVERPEGRLSVEQAEQLVAAAQLMAQRKAEFETTTPEQHVARLAENVAVMRGPVADLPEGEPPPDPDETPLSQAQEIRASLARQAKGYGAGQASNPALRWANGSMAALIRDDDKRRAVRKWLLSGDDNFTTSGWCNAVARWIEAQKVTENGVTTWVPSAQSLADLKIIEAALDLAQPELIEGAGK